MTERISLSLWEPVQAKQAVNHIWNTAKALMLAGHRLVITLAPETRTQAQNRLMWPLLTAYSKQLQWPINGRLVYMTPDEWKDVLSAAFKGETVRLAMGLDGGVVMLGLRTSKFSKKQFAEWIEFLYSTAAARGVDLPAWEGEE
ncbi:recombination protein NinB [Comamonas odontotermitis]|uniref:recombination protein NinB n=1 Tax=Comamonas odontotermitis TaxID=379895 RepID=UPI001CC52344|nr:recombination protein NinB [Comamonas odontotermitis]UBB18351.1 recombination protein NinB [Comamonas odontotermitis]